MNEQRAVIGGYVNGNYKAIIMNDGTKIRLLPDDECIHPVFPESIDMKITNRCNMGCPMCHEMSTPHGAFASLDYPFLQTLRPYTELAIGGGNPLEHPQLKELLISMRDRNVLCNLTVHWDHFIQNRDELCDWQNENLIRGLGISLHKQPTEHELSLIPEHSVIHVIAGYTPLKVIRSLYTLPNVSMLILGYKQFGRASGDMPEHVLNGIVELRECMPEIMNSVKAVVFDNLAIKQLNIKDMLGAENMSKVYMGGEGTHSMYIDLVNGVFARNSTSNTRYTVTDDIDSMFKKITECACVID